MSGISLSAGFDLKSQSPLDLRTQYKTKDEMNAVPITDLYEGLIAYIIDEKKFYRFIDGSWSEFSISGAKVIEITQANYNKLIEDGKLDENVFYLIIDAPEEDEYLDEKIQKLISRNQNVTEVVTITSEPLEYEIIAPNCVLNKYRSVVDLSEVTGLRATSSQIFTSDYGCLIIPPQGYRIYLYNIPSMPATEIHWGIVNKSNRVISTPNYIYQAGEKGKYTETSTDKPIIKYLGGQYAVQVVKLNSDNTALENLTAADITFINSNMKIYKFTSYQGMEFKNLLDETKITSGLVGDSDGTTLYPSSDLNAKFDTTDFIPIKDNDFIFASSNSTNFLETVDQCYLLCYDENKNYLGVIDRPKGYMSKASDWRMSNGNFWYSYYENLNSDFNNKAIRYIRVPIQKMSETNSGGIRGVWINTPVPKVPTFYNKTIKVWGDKNTAIKVDNVYLSSGESLKEISDNVNKLLVGEDVAKTKSAWNGKKWFAYGTSMTDVAGGTGKYPSYLANMAGLVHTNFGKGGSGIIPSLHDGDNIKTRCMRLTDGKADADLITVEIIPNDMSGTLGNPTDTNDSTFCGNLNQILEYLLTNTKARVCVLTATRARYNYQNISETYPPTSDSVSKWILWEDTVAEVCRRHSVPFWNGASNAGIDYYNMIKDNTYVADQIHLTEKGGEALANYYYTELMKIKPLPR